MIANKISYHLDLRGPSIPVDTACGSSLTAFHLAVQALRAGECEAAVVGGCQLNLRYDLLSGNIEFASDSSMLSRLADFVQYSQGSVLAADGKCKPFDASADGYVCSAKMDAIRRAHDASLRFSRGEGAVAVVLKPYEAALRDGDYIYGNVRTAILQSVVD